MLQDSVSKLGGSPYTYSTREDTPLWRGGTGKCLKDKGDGVFGGRVYYHTTI